MQRSRTGLEVTSPKTERSFPQSLSPSSYELGQCGQAILAHVLRGTPAQTLLLDPEKDIQNKVMST